MKNLFKKAQGQSQNPKELMESSRWERIAVS